MLKAIFTKNLVHVLVALIFPAILFQLAVTFSSFLYHNNILKYEPFKLLGIPESFLGFLIFFSVPFLSFVFMLLIRRRADFITSLPLLIYYPLQIFMFFGLVYMRVNDSFYTSYLKNADKVLYPPKEEEKKEEEGKEGSIKHNKYENYLVSNCKVMVPETKGEICFIEFKDNKNVAFYKDGADYPIYIAGGNVSSFIDFYRIRVGPTFKYFKNANKILGELTVFIKENVPDQDESGLYVIDLNKREAKQLISLTQANVGGFIFNDYSFNKFGNNQNDLITIIESNSCASCNGLTKSLVINMENNEIVVFVGHFYRWEGPHDLIYFEDPPVKNYGDLGSDRLEITDMRNFKKFNVYDKKTEPLSKVKYGKVASIRLLSSYLGGEDYITDPENNGSFLEDGYWVFKVLYQDAIDSSSHSGEAVYKVYYDTGKIEKVSSRLYNVE